MLVSHRLMSTRKENYLFEPLQSDAATAFRVAVSHWTLINQIPFPRSSLHLEPSQTLIHLKVKLGRRRSQPGYWRLKKGLVSLGYFVWWKPAITQRCKNKLYSTSNGKKTVQKWPNQRFSSRVLKAHRQSKWGNRQQRKWFRIDAGRLLVYCCVLNSSLSLFLFCLPGPWPKDHGNLMSRTRTRLPVCCVTSDYVGGACAGTSCVDAKI